MGKNIIIGIHQLKWLFVSVIVATGLLVGVVSAAYTQALYNSCFQNIFQFGLCPLNAVVFLPFIVEFCGFLIVHRKTSPPSYALSFLASGIISYLFFGLAIAATASTAIADTYLAVSILLTLCWIAAFAYEINR